MFSVAYRPEPTSASPQRVSASTLMQYKADNHAETHALPNLGIFGGLEANCLQNATGTNGKWLRDHPRDAPFPQKPSTPLPLPFSVRKHLNSQFCEEILPPPVISVVYHLDLTPASPWSVSASTLMPHKGDYTTELQTLPILGNSYYLKSTPVVRPTHYAAFQHRKATPGPQQHYESESGMSGSQPATKGVRDMAKTPTSHYRPKLTTRSSPVHRDALLDSSLPVPQSANMESVYSGPLSVCAVSSQKPVHVHWHPDLVQDPSLICDLEATLEFT